MACQVMSEVLSGRRTRRSTISTELAAHPWLGSPCCKAKLYKQDRLAKVTQYFLFALSGLETKLITCTLNKCDEPQTSAGTDAGFIDGVAFEVLGHMGVGHPYSEMLLSLQK